MSRAIGCRNVSERSMGKMDSKLGYGVRGCRGEVEGWRREARAFMNELASGDPQARYLRQPRSGEGLLEEPGRSFPRSAQEQ